MQIKDTTVRILNEQHVCRLHYPQKTYRLSNQHVWDAEP